MTSLTCALRVAGVTTAGLVRRANEDAASVNGTQLQTDLVFAADLNLSRHVLLLADGMGGHAKGELASTLALAFLNAHADGLDDPAACIETLRAANHHIYDAAAFEPQRGGMGSTIVGAVLTSERLVWFNVGDSRAYLARNGQLRQLSVDHVPKSAAVQGSPRTSAITQSLGGTYRRVDVWPAVGSEDWVTGDRLLLCSDGLSNIVSDPEILERLKPGIDAESSVVMLRDTAIGRGAPDNVTILVAVSRAR